MTASYVPDCPPGTGTTNGFGGNGSHTHDEYLTVPEADVIYSRLGHAHTGFAPTAHTHPYAPTSHNHDNSYFTEAEIIAGYAPLVHTHALAAHTHDQYLDPTEADAIYSNKAHTHTEYLTDADMSDFLTQAEGDSFYAGKSHTHGAGDLTDLPPHTHSQYLTATSGDALFLTPLEGQNMFSALGHAHEAEEVGLPPHGHDERYYTIDDANAEFLNQAEADALFLTHAEGDARYYTEAESDALFMTQAETDARYYTKTDADSIFLTPTQADNLFLTQAEGDARYSPLVHGHPYVLLSDYEDLDVLAKIKAVDGPSSGLDADLLDSQHGSYYSPATHTHAYSPDTHNHDPAYVNVTGDTMTGSLTMSGGATRIVPVEGSWNTGIVWPSGWSVISASGYLMLTKDTTAFLAIRQDSDSYLRLGYGANADKSNYIDFFSTLGAATYNARIIRAPGDGGSFTITHNGTGALAIRTEDAAPIAFQTNYGASASNDLLIGADGTTTMYGLVVGASTIQANSSFRVGASLSEGFGYIFAGGYPQYSIRGGTSNFRIYHYDGTTDSPVMQLHTNANDSYLYLGYKNSSSDRNAYVDFFTNAAASTGVSGRIYRAAGANGMMQVYNYGTGRFYIGSNTQSDLELRTNGVARLQIDGIDGDVHIPNMLTIGPTGTAVGMGRMRPGGAFVLAYNTNAILFDPVPVGIMFIFCSSDASYAIIGYSVTQTHIIADPLNVYSVALGTAGKTNIYISTGKVYIQNLRISGQNRGYSVLFFGVQGTPVLRTILDNVLDNVLDNDATQQPEAGDPLSDRALIGRTPDLYNVRLRDVPELDSINQN